MFTFIEIHYKSKTHLATYIVYIKYRIAFRCNLYRSHVAISLTRNVEVHYYVFNCDRRYNNRR